ncbi:hypothetical protein [Deinococcus aerophilus]|nr:hypothetical protein [Deinococcus aerophilus]
MREPAGALPYSEADARTLASTFVATYLPGATVEEGHTLSGYYTFDYRQGGAEGMLSVNARTGEIWRHTWHGLSREVPPG